MIRHFRAVHWKVELLSFDFCNKAFVLTILEFFNFAGLGKWILFRFCIDLLFTEHKGEGMFFYIVVFNHQFKKEFTRNTNQFHPILKEKKNN